MARHERTLKRRLPRTPCNFAVVGVWTSRNVAKGAGTDSASEQLWPSVRGSNSQGKQVCLALGDAEVAQVILLHPTSLQTDITCFLPHRRQAFNLLKPMMCIRHQRPENQTMHMPAEPRILTTQSLLTERRKKNQFFAMSTIASPVVQGLGPMELLCKKIAKHN